MPDLPEPFTVAVVGGGVTGIAAALEVRALRPDARVLLLESGDRVGGKVRVSEVGGVAVDEGADSLLRRVPEGLELVAAAGLAGELVSPATGEAGVLVGDRLGPLPTGTLMGVPGDLAALRRAGVLSRAGLARAAADLLRPGRAVDSDVSVGGLVRARLGEQVLERLVDPLLGGVYAGRADRLSLRATLPTLAAALRTPRPLLSAARAARAAPTGEAVFAAVPGGLGRVPAAAAAASAAEVRLHTTVRVLSRTPAGWRLETGPAPSTQEVRCDAVVLAVPAPVAARLLADLLPGAAADLAGVEYASVAIVTVALDGPTPGAGSGYLAAAQPGRLTKAVTFSSRKWAHLGSGPAVVRASVGRHGDVADLQRDDAELVGSVLEELAAAVGPVGRVVDWRVSRWGGALPQYDVGHLDRIGRALAAVAGLPGLGIGGAAVHGVGVPACVRSGRLAARSALAGLTMDS